jgi:hypothetical protein
VLSSVLERVRRATAHVLINATAAATKLDGSVPVVHEQLGHADADGADGTAEAKYGLLYNFLLCKLEKSKVLGSILTQPFGSHETRKLRLTPATDLALLQSGR